MRARTWIGIGLLALTAVVVRRGDYASEAAGAATPAIATRRAVAELRGVEPAWSDSTAPRLPDSAPLLPSKQQPVTQPAQLAHALGFELDDEPMSELADSARSTTTATIAGMIRDVETGEQLAGVTVIAVSPSLAQTQTAISDENGQYRIDDLPPGDYTITFYYLDTRIEHADVELAAGRARYEPLVLDPADDASVRDIPVPRRVFEDVLGQAAGVQVDSYGTTFTGVTSIENTYVVDDAPGAESGGM